MKKLSILTIGAVLFYCSCSSPQQTGEDFESGDVNSEPAIDQEVTRTTLNHHLSSFGANDLDAIMQDYTEASIVITPDSIFKGTEQIRGLFESLFLTFPTEGTNLELNKTIIDNEVAYVIWNASTPSVEVPFGTDTFIITDGKIQKQTFAGIINPLQ